MAAQSVRLSPEMLATVRSRQPTLAYGSVRAERVSFCTAVRADVVSWCLLDFRVDGKSGAAWTTGPIHKNDATAIAQGPLSAWITFQSFGSLLRPAGILIETREQRRGLGA
jgi:hypothetical protein